MSSYLIMHAKQKRNFKLLCKKQTCRTCLLQTFNRIFSPSVCIQIRKKCGSSTGNQNGPKLHELVCRLCWTTNLQTIHRTISWHFWQIHWWLLIETASCTSVDLERFVDYVNGFHHALEFTWDSQTCMSFQDISVSINGDALATSVFYKPTDSHIFCFPPPTLTTRSNPSIIPPIFASSPPWQRWQRFWFQNFGNENLFLSNGAIQLIY